MTKLLDRIRGMKEKAETDRLQSQKDDRDEFVQIAIRDLIGKTKKSDAERLAAVMASLGLDESDYTKLVESLSRVCKLLGLKQFHDQFMADLTTQQRKVNQSEVAVEQLRLLLVYASANLASLLRDADRITNDIADAQKRTPFVFDEEGKPVAALYPLIQAEFDQQLKRSLQVTTSADEALAAAAKLPKAKE